MYQSLQGNLGLGKAIDYFTSHNITVALPLNDTQPYDLIADFNGGLQKVSVKTSRATENGKSYRVQLRNTGGNKTGTARQVPFDNKTVDYIFIYVVDGRLFLIPSKEIDITNTITVGIKYLEYEIFTKTFKEFAENIE